MKKVRVILWVAVVLVAVLGVFAYLQQKDQGAQRLALSSDKNGVASSSKKSDTVSFMPVAGLNPVGDFELVDQDGNVFDQDSPAWQSDYKLIYFGFTFCPAICPTELHKMTVALNDLPAEKADKVQPIFISVDPERDTPQVMKKYTSMFHERFIGLTGSVEQVEHMKGLWKVFATKVDDPAMSEYTVDHSSYIYLQGPEGNVLGLFRIRDNAQAIAEYMAKVIP